MYITSRLPVETNKDPWEYVRMSTVTTGGLEVSNVNVNSDGWSRVL